MPYFQVDSERVLAANATISQSISRLNSEVATLHSQLASLQDSWQGTAANSFQELMLRWKQSSDQLEQNLSQIGQALALAAQQYSDAEAANQRLFL